jgi:hypothetical protein
MTTERTKIIRFIRRVRDRWQEASNRQVPSPTAIRAAARAAALDDIAADISAEWDLHEGFFEEPS